jgi:hypothetical protein
MSIADIKQTSGTVTGQPMPESRHDFDVQVINGKAERIHKVTVHQFRMGDVDDPVLYAAQPFLEWEQSEQGTWVMAHALEPPVWHQSPDLINWGHQFIITAKLRGRDYTYWVMKWGTINSVDI